MSKRALISGATGQDGSYLAEILLKKDYEVYGLVRRLSTPNISNIQHIKDDIHLLDGDLMDQSSLNAAVKESQPDEVYNLAAQSFVGTSFVQPALTGEITGLGALRMLEAVKSFAPDARFYQASSSEMFGKVTEEPQNEQTRFHPRSPYGVAKVYAYWACVNYREAHNMFVSNGLLFNHETVAASTPIIFRCPDGFLDIKPVAEVVRDEAGVAIDETRRVYQAGPPAKELEVWDEGGWTRVTYASAYPHDRERDPKHPRIINAWRACFMGTSSHVALLNNGGEKTFGDLDVGDRIALIPHPDGPTYLGVTKDEALLLGILAGDGWVSEDSRHVSVTSSSVELRDFVRDLWTKLGGSGHYFYPTKSGFNKDKVVGKLNLYGSTAWLRSFSLYAKERTPFGDRIKRVPWQILNAPTEIAWEFLRGYNMCDGLKSNPSIYEFRNFKTNSATLAAGLVFLVGKTTEQTVNITVEESRAWGRPTLYYSINLLSNSPFGEVARLEEPRLVGSLLAGGLSQREVARQSGASRVYVRRIAHGYVPPNGHHLARPGDEVKKIVNCDDYDGWFYDLETESGTFHCGVGYGHVHNSPRRGLEFVTRTISHGVARIHLGQSKELRLGNLDAKRDWGFAPEYCDLMMRTLQHKIPDDFVGATGESHSVREFVEEAFRLVGISDWQKYVVTDERRFRPAEVFNLRGDASKAKRLLGWEPKTRFKDLVRIMVEADIRRLEEGRTRP